MRRPGVIAQAAFLLLLSAAVSVVVNLARAKPLPWFQAWSRHVEAATKELGIRTATVDEARRLVEEQTWLILDARPPADYARGRLPGAFNVPSDQIGEYLTQVLPLLTPAQPVMTYCSGTSCDESVLLSKHLLANGFTNIVLFAGGWTDWTAAGLPVEK